MAADRVPRKISLVIPCFNEAEVFPHLRRELTQLLELLSAASYSVEAVLVDDGSRDDTWSLIGAFAAGDPRVRGVSLSRNFGHQAALSCGYDLATGDAVVAMDADLQDPPEVVGQMLSKWTAGADVVYAVRDSRAGESIFKRATASLFYRLMGFLGVRHVRPDTGDFRLLSRRALEALKSLPEYHRFIRGMVGWIGFRTAEVHYARKPRAAGETKFTFWKMLRFAVDAIVSFSIVPLRLSYLAAAVLGSGAIAFLLISLVRFFFFGGQLVSGWPSLILAIVAFGSMVLVCLGIIGEYIGRIYEQTKMRPVYVVMESSATKKEPDPRLRTGGSVVSVTEDAPLPSITPEVTTSERR